MKSRTLLVVVAFLALAGQANAQYSGVITGTIRIRDSRLDPYAAVDSSFSSQTNPPPGAALLSRFSDPSLPAPLVPAPQIRVEVCVSLGYLPCVPQWARTSNAGTYSVPWSGFLPPTSIHVRVWAVSPTSGAVIGDPLQPGYDFRIAMLPIGGWISLGSVEVPAPLTGTRTVNLNIAASEAGNAFLTAIETYRMLDAQTQPPGGSIRSDMRSVNIFANDVLASSPTGGVTPVDSAIYLLPTTATQSPFSVAHEIGHIASWRAYDVVATIVGPLEYSECDGESVPAWRDFSEECEKAAFQEGFAHVVASAWMWLPTAPTPRVLGATNEFPLEALTTSCVAIPGLRRPHMRAACNARALWDIIDNPAGDDDPLGNADLGHVIRVLRSYPSCSGNGCAVESGLDGMNWSDYARNHVTLLGQSTSISTIEATNALGGSADD